MNTQYKKYDFVIVGTGITGATISNKLALEGNTVLAIDKRIHIAGNCYDERNKNGILYHKYGPHIFHTNMQHIVDYLSNFTDWYDYEHKVLGLVDGRYIPIPFNLTSLKICFPCDEAVELKKSLVDSYGYGAKIPILQMIKTDQPHLQRLARYIYDKIFNGYTIKQWGMGPKELDPSVSARVPVHISYDDRYFQDSFQKMPKDGYTQMISRMLSHKNITVLLNQTWGELKNKVKYGCLVYTGTIDGYFNYCLGKLPYRSLHFDLQEYAQSMHQPVAQVNYPNNHTFTRITEMVHLSREYKSTTLLALEYPQPYIPSKNEPYYPIPHEKNARLYKRYAELARIEAPDVIFAGRLGKYRYYNMDQAISHAFQCAEEILQ